MLSVNTFSPPSNENHALDKLSEEKAVEPDDEKKAAMVSNLLVVLCSDEHAQPVVNTETLHN